MLNEPITMVDLDYKQNVRKMQIKALSHIDFGRLGFTAKERLNGGTVFNQKYHRGDTSRLQTQCTQNVISIIPGYLD